VAQGPKMGTLLEKPWGGLLNIRLSVENLPVKRDRPKRLSRLIQTQLSGRRIFAAG
jgi:hypothetical protein